MARKVRSYEGEGVVIDFEARRCIHAAKCVSGLPGVFDADRRPWIDATQGTVEEIVRVVESCPSGALTYRRQDGGPEEAVPTANSVRVEPNGPLYASGDLRVQLGDDESPRVVRAALCRCGHSANKPFCDNAHIDAGFEDGGVIVDGRMKEGDAGDDAGLEVVLADKGPLLLRGPVTVVGADGSTSSGVGGALCRCGHSTNKPFCDGSHKAAGFMAEE